MVNTENQEAASENNLVSNKRFQQKRQEAETGMRPFPDEIRGAPIDFAAAKAALDKKAESGSEPTEIKITAGSESEFMKIQDDRMKLMTELDDRFHRLEQGLQTKRAADLEKIRQTNPDVANLLEDHLNLEEVRAFWEQKRTAIFRADTKKSLDEISQVSREFLDHFSKVS